MLLKKINKARQGAREWSFSHNGLRSYLLLSRSLKEVRKDARGSCRKSFLGSGRSLCRASLRSVHIRGRTKESQRSKWTHSQPSAHTGKLECSHLSCTFPDFHLAGGSLVTSLVSLTSMTTCILTEHHSHPLNFLLVWVFICQNICTYFWKKLN